MTCCQRNNSWLLTALAVLSSLQACGATPEGKPARGEYKCSRGGHDISVSMPPDNVVSLADRGDVDAVLKIEAQDVASVKAAGGLTRALARLKDEDPTLNTFEARTYLYARLFCSGGIDYPTWTTLNTRAAYLEQNGRLPRASIAQTSPANATYRAVLNVIKSSDVFLPESKGDGDGKATGLWATFPEWKYAVAELDKAIKGIPATSAGKPQMSAGMKIVREQIAGWDIENKVSSARPIGADKEKLSARIIMFHVRDMAQICREVLGLPEEDEG